MLERADPVDRERSRAASREMRALDAVGGGGGRSLGGGDGAARARRHCGCRPPAWRRASTCTVRSRRSTTAFGCVVFGREREHGLAAALASFGAAVALVSDTPADDALDATVDRAARGPRSRRPDPPDPAGAAAGRSRRAVARTRDRAAAPPARRHEGRLMASRESSPPAPQPGVTVIGCVQADVLMSPVSELPPAGRDRAHRGDEHPRRRGGRQRGARARRDRHAGAADGVRRR